ncbi:hypothetical protein [Brachybacterium sp. AOP24-D1-21]|uniref:hypothetical protein n=1 Tax=Brachybacterium sp. AOP24-D1-21 TaxID=3457711 RepID=UPI0040331F0F
MELYPVEHLRKEPVKEKRAQVDAIEYSAYVHAIRDSKYKAILNEKIPPVSPLVELPASHRFTGSSRFVVNDPAGAGIHATVFAALVSRIRIR